MSLPRPARTSTRPLRAPLLVLLALALVLGPVLGATASPPSAAASQAEYAPDRILVKFRPGTPGDLVRSINARNGAVERRAIPKIDVRVLNVPKNKTVEQMVEIYSKNPNVVFAEPDYVVKATGVVPNDPYYPNQYAMPQINAPAGWEFTTGNPDVVIAVLDTGVNADHPDLAGRVIQGYNFVDGTTDITDIHGHGTMVAGVAAAGGNNGIGVAGVSWTSTIMPVQVLSATGSGSTSSVAEGIVWAADNGANVINMSLGGSGTTTLQSAVSYAAEKECLLVAALGNAGTIQNLFPAAYPEVIAVGSVNSLDERSTFSNYGRALELMAPGEQIWTTSATGAYRRFTGTSAATPFVAGLAALLWSADGSLTAAEIRESMRLAAVDLGSPGWDDFFGWGRIDIAAALAMHGVPTTPPAPEPPVAPEPEPPVAPEPEPPVAPEPEPPVAPEPEPQPERDQTPPDDPRDVIAPSVAITSPANGAVVSGRVTVTCDATDNVGVTRVDYYLSGTLVASVASAPYRWNWNTNKLSGSYTIVAVAYDAAGNWTASKPVTVTVGSTNTKQPPGNSKK